MLTLHIVGYELTYNSCAPSTEEESLIRQHTQALVQSHQVIYITRFVASMNESAIYFCLIYI